MTGDRLKSQSESRSHGIMQAVIKLDFILSAIGSKESRRVTLFDWLFKQPNTTAKEHNDITTKIIKNTAIVIVIFITIITIY